MKRRLAMKHTTRGQNLSTQAAKMALWIGVRQKRCQNHPWHLGKSIGAIYEKLSLVNSSIHPLIDWFICFHFVLNLVWRGTLASESFKSWILGWLVDDLFARFSNLHLRQTHEPLSSGSLAFAYLASRTMWENASSTSSNFPKHPIAALTSSNAFSPDIVSKMKC